MTVNIGDKLVVTKKIASFLDVDDIVRVVDVDESGVISFAFGENFMHKGIMNATECEEHFAKVKEKVAPTITSEMVEEILSNSEIMTETVFDKCTIVSCRLPNGFVIVESSACVSPENYNEEMGLNICLDKITNKIWELEGYRLQEEIYRTSTECECPCNECDWCVEADEEVDCLDTDLDCDDCTDSDCPFNSIYRI